MILDLPTPQHYLDNALQRLNLAWQIGMEIAETLASPASQLGAPPPPEYWRAAQPELGAAVAHVAEAQELTLKGLIAAISPYFLLWGSVREWPKGAASRDTPFSRFRTIDASDLIRTYNTICDPNRRLQADFEAEFLDLRSRRNEIAHFGSSSQKIDPTSVLMSVMNVCERFYGGKPWVSYRQRHLHSDFKNYAMDDAMCRLQQEIGVAEITLTATQFRRFLGTKRGRTYRCPQCLAESYMQFRIPLAQLSLADRTLLDCRVCLTTTRVIRTPCTSAGCKSDVICAEGELQGHCLLCSEF